MARMLQAVNAYGPKVALNPTTKLDQVADWMAMRTGLNKSERLHRPGAQQEQRRPGQRRVQGLVGRRPPRRSAGNLAPTAFSENPVSPLQAEAKPGLFLSDARYTGGRS
jgi:hypothetical protein